MRILVVVFLLNVCWLGGCSRFEKSSSNALGQAAGQSPKVAPAPVQNHHHFNVMFDDAKVDIQVDDSSAYAKGRWAALDEQSSIPGIDTSEILCLKAAMVCHETEANLTDRGDGTFTLEGNSIDYQITRWTRTEIVGQSIGGVCRVLSALKFDLTHGKVYASQSLSEPIENLPKMSKEMCQSVGMRLELHASGVYHVGETLNTAPNK
jgi:hypothetical protein